MKLIINHYPYKTFNDYDLHECEKAILADKIVEPARPPSYLYLRLIRIVVKLFNYLKLNNIMSTPDWLLKDPISDSNHLITLMIGPDYQKYLPYSYFLFRNRSIYMFDAWPCHHDSIVSFVSSNRIDHLFVTSHKVSLALEKLLPSTNVYWIPEAIDPNCYIHSRIKTIDVIAFGRKYDRYHESILPYLYANNRIYLFEKVKGQVIFENRSHFIKALGTSKISVCFPSSVTHPERAGDTEIMTMRYLQSIVSKCLVVGKAPQEMIELFGYNPVVEIDWNNPVGQIDTILRNFDLYQDLIEKNYTTVINNHTWHHRWNLIKQSFKNKKK